MSTDLKPGGLIIADEGEFGARNLAKAGYDGNPLDDDTLAKWQVIRLNISQLTLDAVKPFGLGNKEALRCKNMWTLGLALWMFDRDRAPIVDWLKAKFAKAPELAEANIAALNAGHAYGETAEMGGQVAPAPYRRRARRARPLPHRHRRRGDLARPGRGLPGSPACRCSSAAIRSRPASAILHHLSRLKEYGVTTFQAEDEIAAIAAAIGASFAGSLGVTSSSGPGIALKGEAMGLAIMTELPLVIVNSQRGGPSTGLPTKTEQSDLYQAVYGRNADAPMPVIAARSPADAFDCAIEACRIAVQYMTPVMLLTDGYIANAAEPWQVPDMASYEPFPVAFHDEAPGEGEAVNPYARDDKLARVWIKPGTPGLMHRIGGIEKNVGTGHIDYDPGQPPGDDRHPRRQGARRRRHPAPTRRSASARRAAGSPWSAGARPSARSTRRSAAPAATATTSATSTSATSGRCRTISAIC